MTMASPDLSQLILYTPDNAYKNVNVYPGSISFPTSLTAGQTATVTTTVNLEDNPVFIQFFGNFLEIVEAISLYGTGTGTTPKRWYSNNIGGSFGIGLHVTTSPHTGWINGGIFPTINGNVATVSAIVINPYSSTVSLNAVTVNFSFVEYTLAN